MVSEFRNYEDWLTQIKKELKTEPAPYAISEDLYANPFIRHTKIDLPKIQREAATWIIAQKVASAEELQASLNGGVIAICLTINETANFEDLLGHTYLEMISLKIITSEIKVWQELHHYLISKKYNLAKLDFIVSGLPIEDFNIINKLFNHNLFFEIQVNPDNFSSALLLAEEIITNNPARLAFSLPAKENFYFNLGNYKALRHICRKILEVNNFTYKWRIIADIRLNQTTPSLQAIELTQLTTSAIIGQADWIELENLSFSDTPLFAQRITRNIQNILYHESFLARVKDPAKGSYFLDDLTRNIIQKNWEAFLQKINKNYA